LRASDGSPLMRNSTDCTGATLQDDRRRQPKESQPKKSSASEHEVRSSGSLGR
jgi:hypothetical protein